MEYYSVIRRNELSSYEKAWRNLKCTLLSERSQSRRQHTIWVQLNINIKEKINYRDSKKVNGCQGLIVGGGRDE